MQIEYFVYFDSNFEEMQVMRAEELCRVLFDAQILQNFNTIYDKFMAHLKYQWRNEIYNAQ